MTWGPVTYPAMIRAEIHHYDELQARVAAATLGVDAQTILDLGVGAGETARRVLSIHRDAHLVAIDSSAQMLRAAAEALRHSRVTVVQQQLSDPLPDQPFDLAISALALHHLDDDAKTVLFHRLAHALRPNGRLVLGDVVVPADSADALIDCEPGYDFPSTVEQHLEWMSEAGFASEVAWVCKDLAIFSATLRERSS